MSRKKILAISGSTKAGSTNAEILKMLEGMCQATCDFETYPIARLPFFDPDLDNEQVPKEVIAYRDKLVAADAVVICSPEYVFSLPGVLKNALEWTVSSSSFSGKPVGLIIASSLGEKAYESLRLIMKTIEAKTEESTSLLIQGAKSKIEKGDGKTKEALLSLMNALIDKM